MSLELAIAENTRAINQLIAILRDQAANPVPAELKQAPEPEQLIQEDPPKTKKAKKEEPAPAPEPETPKAVTYAEAASAVTKLVKEKGREAAKALLAGFNATNLKEIPEARFADVIAAAENALR
jgi:hypothetical protein